MDTFLRHFLIPNLNVCGVQQQVPFHSYVNLVKTNSTINIIQFFLSHCVFQQEDQGISIQCNMKSISFPSLAYYRFFMTLRVKLE
jgi:hypothetical protein